MKLALIVGIVAATLASPVAASATGHHVTTRIAVSSAGLQIDQPAGAERMLARLERAALRVCGASHFGARDHQVAVRESVCYRDAMEQAVSAVKASAVGAAYRGGAASTSY